MLRQKGASECNFRLKGRLSSANLGDSGFLVLGSPRPHESDMRVKYHSPQQEHQFGFPYQLGHYASADSPDSAMLMTLPVSRSFVSVGNGLQSPTKVPGQLK